MAAVSSRTAETVLAKKIVGFGNPLLDISANVGQDVLDEWGAKLNNAILAEEQHKPLYAKLASTQKCDYIAGGATLNSIRVAQWLLTASGKGGCTSFIGCIGKGRQGGRNPNLIQQSRLAVSMGEFS